VFSEANGCQFFDSGDFEVTGNIAATANESEGIYELNLENPRSFGGNNAKSFSAKESIKLWHKRLGHLNNADVNLLKSKDCHVDFPSQDKYYCEACLAGKMCRLPFKSSAFKANSCRFVYL